MKWLIPFLVFTSVARADSVLPIPEETRSRYMPDDSTVSGEYEYKKRYTSEAEKNAQLQDEVNKARDALSAKLKAGLPVISGPAPAKQSATTRVTRRSPANIRFNPNQASFQDSRVPAMENTLQSFHLSKAEYAQTTLPMGASVKVTVLSGVESANEPLPMLVQLDSTFVGPNHTRIDLRHCMMMAKARGNLSNERVYAETTEC